MARILPSVASMKGIVVLYISTVFLSPGTETRPHRQRLLFMFQQRDIICLGIS